MDNKSKLLLISFLY